MAKRRASGAYAPASAPGYVRPSTQERLNSILKKLLLPPILWGKGTPSDRFCPAVAKGIATAIAASVSMEEALELARLLRKLCWDWVASYGGSFDDFRPDWVAARMWLPLQTRLMVEQVLWDKGGPWRSLVSGFKPIE